MNSINFNHYTTGTGKQKAWAWQITKNIVNGENTLRREDYDALQGLIEEALVKCVMKEYMERVKRCEIDKVSNEVFKKVVNETLAVVNQALKQKTVKGKREALIHEVRHPEVIINFRHSYSTLEWAQITFIHLLNQRLNLNLKATEYRIKACRA